MLTIFRVKFLCPPTWFAQKLIITAIIKNLITFQSFMSKKLIFYLFPTVLSIQNFNDRKKTSNKRLFSIRSIFTIDITEKKFDVTFTKNFKISIRKVTLRFDDSVFTTKTKCALHLLVLYRCLSPGQSWFIANSRRRAVLVNLQVETEIPSSSLNKEPNSGCIHCHKPWISINHLISLFFNRNLFHFVSRVKEGFSLRRNKIFFFEVWYVKEFSIMFFLATFS